MIQIAQANCQSPPIVDGSGKPVGCNLQPGNAENEFKEVLRKEKSKDDVDPDAEAAVLAGNSMAAMPVNETQHMLNLVESVSDALQGIVPDVSATFLAVEESDTPDNGDVAGMIANNATNRDMAKSVEVVSNQDSTNPLTIESAPTGQDQQIQLPFTQPGMISQDEAMTQQAVPTLKQMPVNIEPEEGTPIDMTTASSDSAGSVTPTRTVEFQSGIAISIDYESEKVDGSPYTGNRAEIFQTTIPIVQAQQEGKPEPVETQQIPMDSSHGSEVRKSSQVAESTNAKTSKNSDPIKANSTSEQSFVVQQQPTNSSEFVSEAKASVIAEHKKSEQNLPVVDLQKTVEKTTEKAADAGQADMQVNTQGKQATKDGSLNMGWENNNNTVQSAQVRATVEAATGSDNTEQMLVTITENKAEPVPDVKSEPFWGEVETEQTNEVSITQRSELSQKEKVVSQNEMAQMVSIDSEQQVKSEVAATVGNEEIKKPAQKSSSPNGLNNAVEKSKTGIPLEELNITTSIPATPMKEKSEGVAAVYAQYDSETKGNDTVQFSLQEGGKLHQDLNGNIQASQNPGKEKIVISTQPTKVQDQTGNKETGMMDTEVFTSFMTQNVNLFSSTRNTSEVSTLHIQQIVNEVDQSLQAGKNVIRIQLHPENLGKIDIRLSSDASGLGINIMAENASTKQLLESQVEILRQSLDNAGLHLSHMNFGMKGQEGQNERQFYQNNPLNVSQSWLQKPWRESETEKYSDTPQRMSLQLTSIDYRI
jgi:flagellar hook-length control protein FliK